MFMADTFKTLTRFQYSSEAQIIKGRLEAEGIRVFLADNITIDTDPLVSNAIGGVKMKVYRSQYNEALRILNSIADYSMDDDGRALSCPNCHGHHIELFSNIRNFKSFVSFLIGLLFGTLPLHAKYSYRCEDCKTEFNLRKV